MCLLVFIIVSYSLLSSSLHTESLGYVLLQKTGRRNLWEDHLTWPELNYFIFYSLPALIRQAFEHLPVVH